MIYNVGADYDCVQCLIDGSTYSRGVICAFQFDFCPYISMGSVLVIPMCLDIRSYLMDTYIDPFLTDCNMQSHNTKTAH